MKLLLLMPCDEQHVYAATTIYNNLPAEYKDKCFSMPMFMQYLITTRTVGNWIMAFYDTLVSAKNLWLAADKTDEDIIIIGNIGCEYNFDEIFNFQDIEEDLPYEDKFIEKIKDIVKDDLLLSQYVAALHKADESKMALHNCVATADFIWKIMESEPNLKQIEKEYQKKLKEIKGKK